MNEKSRITQRYLKKIGFHQAFSPSYENLKALLSLHTLSIPFGNITSFIDENVSLNINDIADKLLTQGREGYCLEHSLLTKTVLQDLGFETFNLLARVYYHAENLELSPIQTHLITIVKMNDSLYLYDPGFGGITPTIILSLNKLGEVCHSSLEKFRIVDIEDIGLPHSARIGMKLMLQVYLKEQWMNVYAFNPEQEFSFSDILVANWFISTSPESAFTQNLMMAIVKDNKRVSLNNNIFRVHDKLGSKKVKLFTEDDFRDVIQNEFGVNIEGLNFCKLVEKTKAFST